MSAIATVALLGAGSLVEGPARRVSSAFTLVVTAGEYLTQSDGCLREIQSFIDACGEPALDRICVVGLTEAAVQALLEWPGWPAAAAERSLQNFRFYNEREPQRLAAVHPGKGLLSPVFRTAFEALRDSLRTELQHSLGSVPLPTAAPTAAAAGAAPRPMATIYIESNRNERRL